MISFHDKTRFLPGITLRSLSGIYFSTFTNVYPQTACTWLCPAHNLMRRRYDDQSDSNKNLVLLSCLSKHTHTHRITPANRNSYISPHHSSAIQTSTSLRKHEGLSQSRKKKCVHLQHVIPPSFCRQPSPTSAADNLIPLLHILRIFPSAQRRLL